MKGYYTPFGYMGCVDGRYYQFPSEEEYEEYIKAIADEQEETAAIS